MGELVVYGWNERIADAFSALDGSLSPARVVRVERTRSVVVASDGVDQVVTASSVPAVGDWVGLEGDEITRTVPRSTTLVRLDPDGVTSQVLAANVDVILITVPADRPSAARVERELAVAWGSGGQPYVVITKCDLIDGTLHDSLEARLVGVEVLSTSVRTGAGIAPLRALLADGKTAVLLGPSGAGKSSLVNHLVGEERLSTGDVRGDSRGRHTTTSRQLVVVPTGGVIIDSPGLRGLGLVGGEVDKVFPEIAAVIGTCRFDNCTHNAEPGCAVRDALRKGTFDADRFDSYRKLSAEIGGGATSATALTTHSRAASTGHRTRRHEVPPEIDDDELDEDDDLF